MDYINTELAIETLTEALKKEKHNNGILLQALMEVNNGIYAWMVKIGEKGQFVIPKEARNLFDLQPGMEILVLGDEKRGLAILPKEMQKEYIARIFSEMDS